MNKNVSTDIASVWRSSTFKFSFDFVRARQSEFVQHARRKIRRHRITLLAARHSASANLAVHHRPRVGKRHAHYRERLDAKQLTPMATQPASLQENPPVEVAPEVTAAPASWPACPLCHSTEFVHRAGFRYLKQYPPMQKYECTKCGKGKKFFAPSEVKHRPGKIRNLKPAPTVPIVDRLEEIRQLATQFPQREVALTCRRVSLVSDKAVPKIRHSRETFF